VLAHLQTLAEGLRKYLHRLFPLYLLVSNFFCYGLTRIAFHQFSFPLPRDISQLFSRTIAFHFAGHGLPVTPIEHFVAQIESICCISTMRAYVNSVI